MHAKILPSSLNDEQSCLLSESRLVGTSPNTFFIQSHLVLSATACHIVHLKVRGWELPSLRLSVGETAKGVNVADWWD